MKNYITIRDALIESVHITKDGTHITKDGTPIIESFREAFRIRKLVNMWLAHEISFVQLLDVIDGI